MRSFYTEQELMSMPLQVLRGLDIETKDQETLVQKVVNRRVAALPPSSPIFRRDVPDIENQEQEKEWQQKINERTARLKPRMEDESPESQPEPQEDPTPAEPAPIEPTQPVARMRESDMAQPTGEGSPLILSSTVNSALSSGKKIKKAK